VRLPEDRYSNSHGARPVYLINAMTVNSDQKVTAGWETFRHGVACFSVENERIPIVERRHLNPKVLRRPCCPSRQREEVEVRHF
jgi:hypothetical protein